MTDRLADILRIPESLEFDSRAAALKDQLDALEEGRAVGQDVLQNATAKYFSHLADAAKLSSQPGTMAEFAAVMEAYMPVPDLGIWTSPVRLLLTDLTALCASNYLHIPQSSSYYSVWRNRRTDDFDGENFFDAQPLLHAGADTLVNFSGFDLATKAQIFELMAEVLHRDNFDPAEQLRAIKPLSRLTPERLFALQIWQRQWSETRTDRAGAAETIETELRSFFDPVNGSIENTLLYWIADPDPANRQLAEFSEYLFVSWGWLRAVAYDAVSAAQLSAPGRAAQQELEKARLEHPLGVAQRELEPADLKFPFALNARGRRYGFKAIPILPVGESGYGKTSFLCAFADLTIANQARLVGNLEVRTDGLLRLLNDFGDEWRSGDEHNTVSLSEYRFAVGRTGSNNDSWATFELSDYKGEDSQIGSEGSERAQEFDTRLADTKGIFLFVDERAFAPKVTAKRRAITQEIAARYQTHLTRFLEHSRTLHVPVALVINKADLIFGDDWAEKLGTTRIVVEGTQRGIAAGAGVAGEPTSPYERLLRAIRYNKAISRDAEVQGKLLEFMKQFEAFFVTMLDATHRYQIFLTTSVNSPKKNPRAAVRGVLEAMSWMIDQLLPDFDRQAAQILTRDIRTIDDTLIELQKKLREADTSEARWKQNQGDLAKRQGRARLGLSLVVDWLTGKTVEKLQSNVDINAKVIGAVLKDICDTAKVGGYPELEAPPFSGRRVVAKAAITEIEELKARLTTLRDGVTR